MKVSAFFQRLPRDRPVLGILAGTTFFLLASSLRAMLGNVSEGFGPMTLLPSILLAGLFGGSGKASQGGTNTTNLLFLESTFTATTLANTDQLALTWTVTV